MPDLKVQIKSKILYFIAVAAYVIRGTINEISYTAVYNMNVQWREKQLTLMRMSVIVMVWKNKISKLILKFFFN